MPVGDVRLAVYSDVVSGVIVGGRMAPGESERPLGDIADREVLHSVAGGFADDEVVDGEWGSHAPLCGILDSHILDAADGEGLHMALVGGVADIGHLGAPGEGLRVGGGGGIAHHKALSIVCHTRAVGEVHLHAVLGARQFGRDQVIGRGHGVVEIEAARAVEGTGRFLAPRIIEVGRSYCPASVEAVGLEVLGVGERHHVTGGDGGDRHRVGGLAGGTVSRDGEIVFCAHCQARDHDTGGGEAGGYLHAVHRYAVGGSRIGGSVPGEDDAAGGDVAGREVLHGHTGGGGLLYDKVVDKEGIDGEVLDGHRLDAAGGECLHMALVGAGGIGHLADPGEGLRVGGSGGIAHHEVSSGGRSLCAISEVDLHAVCGACQLG